MGGTAIVPRDLTDQVAESFAGTPDPRLREILTALTLVLHRFVEDVQLTQEEWEHAIAFLTAVGQKCDATRQEFILLSDVLGVSMLVETVNQADTDGVTDSTILGPFHMTTSPPRRSGDTIDLVGTGRTLVLSGRLLGADGAPLAGATVDVWQADDNGFYDVQVLDRQPPGNGRGLFTTDRGGRFWFRTVEPAPYPIPADGPVGELLAATRRHPYRPAHIHFIATAAGHHPLTTHIFVKDSPYLDSDAVFAVKRSLVMDITDSTDPVLAERYGVDTPFRYGELDLVLAKAVPADKIAREVVEPGTDGATGAEPRS